MAESYFQHAEHYFRILNAMNQAAATQQGGQPQGQQAQSNQGYGRRNDSSNDGNSDGDDQDDEPAGLGDQPGDSREREIPITASSPEG